MSLSNASKKIKESNNDNLDTAQDYVSYFESKGYTREQAAGIVGSLQQESNLSPTIVNKNSGAYGIAQWLGSRKKELKQYVASHGGVADKKTQLDFIIHELNTKEKSANKALKGARSAGEAAVIWSKKFERPGALEANNERRARNAERLASGENWRVGEGKADKFTDKIQLAKNTLTDTKTIAGIGAVGIASQNKTVKKVASKVASKVDDIAGKVASKIKDKILPNNKADKKTDELTQNVSEAHARLKQPKRIAYETADLTGWHKRVIELMTDWANKGRDDGRNGTVSIKQAVIESGNQSADNVAIKETDTDINKLETESSIFGEKTPMEQKLRWLAVTQAVQNDTVISGIEAIEKGDISKFKTPRIFKALTGKLDAPINTPNINYQPVKSINEAIVLPAYQTPISVKSEAIKPIKNAIVNKPIVKEIPTLEVSNKPKKQRQIIINNEENVEESISQTVYLFPEKYDARKELDQLWLEGKSVGHGLRTGVH